LNAEAKTFADVTKSLSSTTPTVFTLTTGKHCKETPEDKKFTAGLKTFLFLEFL
jgi:hypothetical protein